MKLVVVKGYVSKQDSKFVATIGYTDSGDEDPDESKDKEMLQS